MEMRTVLALALIAFFLSNAIVFIFFPEWLMRRHKDYYSRHPLLRRLNPFVDYTHYNPQWYRLCGCVLLVVAVFVLFVLVFLPAPPMNNH